MKLLNRLSVTNFIIIIFIFSATLAGYVFIQNQNAQFKQELTKLKKIHNEQQKELLKNEIQNAVDFINYTKDGTKERLKKEIKDRVYQAYQIMESLHNKFKDTHSKEEIITMMKESLRSIRFFDGRGYYFINSLEDISILHSIFPEYEGTNHFLNFRNIDGEHIISKLRKVATSKEEEGFVMYKYFRPDFRQEQDLKISFVKLFKPYGIYISSAEYIKDYEYGVKQEIFDRLREVRYGKDGYLFIDDWDGTILMHPMKPHIVGNNLMEYTDKNGVKVIRDLIEASKKPHGDFVYYSWTKPSTKEEIHKVSFAMGIKEWKWMVGGGVYVEDVDTEILEKQLAFEKQTKDSVSKTVLIIVVFLIILFIVMFWWNQNVKNSFKKFTNSLKQASIQQHYVNEDDVPFNEFKDLAKAFNHMIQAREATQNDLKKVTDELSKVNKELEKRVQEEVNKNIQQEKILAEQSKHIAMGEMIGNIAHQWRQPLTELSLILQKFKFMYDRDMLTKDLIYSETDIGKKLVKKNVFYN
jgi:signal transduction histidine kinase